MMSENLHLQPQRIDDTSKAEYMAHVANQEFNDLHARNKAVEIYEKIENNGQEPRFVEDSMKRQAAKRVLGYLMENSNTIAICDFDELYHAPYTAYNQPNVYGKPWAQDILVSAYFLQMADSGYKYDISSRAQIAEAMNRKADSAGDKYDANKVRLERYYSNIIASRTPTLDKFRGIDNLFE